MPYSDTSKRDIDSQRNNNAQGNADALHLLGEYGIDLLHLARTEMARAVSRFPKIFLLWLLHIPALVFMWISFSLLPAWTVYSLSGWIFAGLFTFFVMQAIIVILIRRLLEIKIQEASFPYTREYTGRLLAMMVSESDMANAANDEDPDK